MPKRIPTPPPGDDEPRYLTVVHPYAISGTCNMELPKDRQDFARWVACCVDKDAFFAIFHKPSSRGMVIIEVNRDYAHFDRILGEHRWSEFLISPSKEEKDRVTQVFYCTYNTGRIVQKNGWKRIDVEEAWFRGWSPNNRCIKFPYPATHFCDVPIEDQTNHSLCRPLPGAVKLPPPEVIAAPQPVVGSAQWIQSKEGGTTPAPATMPTKAKGAWGKGALKAQATLAKPNPTANGSVKKTVSIPQGPPGGIKVPAIGGGPVVVKSSNVWQNKGNNKRPATSTPPVAVSWEDAEAVSGRNTPASRGISPAPHTAPPGLASRTSAWNCPPHPPGLTLPSGASVSTSSDTHSAPDRAANFSAASWVSNGASTSSPDSESGPDLTTATESDNPYKVHIHFSESMEEEFHGLKLQDNDEGDLADLDAMAPVAWNEPMATNAWEDTQDMWDTPVDAESEWRKKQDTQKPVLCNAHGVICKKGICAEYAKQVRLAKREEERKKAAANKGKKGARGKGSGAAKPKESDSGEKKKTPQANAFRGPGAPVKTNWRGAPRAIVSADAIEKREGTKATSTDGSESESDDEPNAAAVVANAASDDASNASWGVSENSFNPWSTSAAPLVKANRSGGGGKPQARAQTQAQKKPAAAGQTKVASSWADEVESEMAGGGADGFSTVSSKSRGRGSKGGKSSTSGWGAGAAKSSTSGWGTVEEMPW